MGIEKPTTTREFHIADDDKSKIAAIKERLSVVFKNVLESMVKRGISPEQAGQILCENLNDIDDNGDWSLTIERYH